MRLALAAALVVAAPVHAQIGVDFNVGPTVNWTEDVTAVLLDAQTGSASGEVQTFDVPVQVGLQGGLGVSFVGGPIGVRVAGQFLNTSALYDGEGDGLGFNAESFETTFVTLQLDLQLVRRLGPATAYVFGGPEARYLVDLSNRIGSLDDLQGESELLGVTANVGAGLRLGLMGVRVGPEVRYAYDLTGVGSGGQIPTPSGAAQVQEAFDVNTLLFGLVFGGP